MAAPRHRNFAYKRDLPATNCDGFIRRLYVQPGSRGYIVPIGWACDVCAVTHFDPDRHERIEAAKEAGRRLGPTSVKHGPRPRTLDGKPIRHADGSLEFKPLNSE